MVVNLSRSDLVILATALSLSLKLCDFTGSEHSIEEIKELYDRLMVKAAQCP